MRLRMMPLRDGLALVVARIAAGAHGGLFILPAVYRKRLAPGDLSGTILSYEVRVSKYGGTWGSFAVWLDREEALRVAAQDGPVPGDRVCIRAVQRGDMVEGFLVAMERCSSP